MIDLDHQMEAIEISVDWKLQVHHLSFFVVKYSLNLSNIYDITYVFHTILFSVHLYFGQMYSHVQTPSLYISTVLTQVV